jgi:hypothetical protein
MVIGLSAAPDGQSLSIDIKAFFRALLVVSTIAVDALTAADLTLPANRLTNSDYDGSAGVFPSRRAGDAGSVYSPANA